MPDKVCLSVMGEGLRAMLGFFEGGGDLELSDPRTSFRETLGPLEATCQGDAGLSFGSGSEAAIGLGAAGD